MVMVTERVFAAFCILGVVILKTDGQVTMSGMFTELYYILLMLQLCHSAQQMLYLP